MREMGSSAGCTSASAATAARSAAWSARCSSGARLADVCIRDKIIEDEDKDVMMEDVRIVARVEAGREHWREKESCSSQERR
jgi:hypothetical protein